MGGRDECGPEWSGVVMEKANSAGAESDSRTSGMPQNKTHKVCVIPLVVGQQMVKL